MSNLYERFIAKWLAKWLVAWSNHKRFAFMCLFAAFLCLDAYSLSLGYCKSLARHLSLALPVYATLSLALAYGAEQLTDLIISDDEMREELRRLWAIAEDGCDGEFYRKLEGTFYTADLKVSEWLEPNYY